ncbi:MAG: hypothetical protein P8179_20450 [Candidatus Thiodiazotropha sp.]
MKGALVVVQGKKQRRGIARYSKELQRRHAPPQAHPSSCSVIHPVGDHHHRSYFLQNQIPVIRMERSTDFFRFKPLCVSEGSRWTDSKVRTGIGKPDLPGS